MYKRFKFSSEFSINVLTLLSGTFIAQLIPFAVSPWLTRIYTPDDFGVLAIVLGAATVLASLLNGRYDAAILVPEDHVIANRLLQIALFMPVVLAVIVWFLMVVIPDTLLLHFGLTSSTAHLMLFIPILAVLFTYYMSFDVFLNRHKAYRKMSYLMIFRVFFVSLFQIIFGYLFSNGLLYGLFTGMAIGSIAGIFYVYQYTQLGNVNLVQITSTAKEYKNYPLFHMPHTFFNALSNNMPMILIPFFFTVASSGFYLLALKVFYTPFSMLGASIEKVFRRHVLDALHHKHEIAPHIKSMLKKIIFLSIIPYTLCVWYAPEIFSFILGANWYKVGIYIQVLAPWIYTAFVVSVFVGVPIILEKQKKSLMIEIVYFVSRIGGLVAGAIVSGDIYVALGLYVFGGTIVILYNLFWIYSLAKQTDREQVN